MAMFSEALRHLLEKNLTTRKEIQDVTGRGASTIYRWLNAETEPQYHDIRSLVRRMQNPEARRTLVGLLTGGLPVTIKWLEDDVTPNVSTKELRDEASEHALDASLLALECISELLVEEREAMRQKSISTEKAAHVIELCDEVIRQLTVVKNTAVAVISTENKATPPPS